MSQLHQKVGTWLSRATEYQQANVTDAVENLASCPSDAIAAGNTVITVIDGVRVRFAEVPLPEEKYCIVLLEPQQRALNFDEARDVQTALIVQPEQDLNEIARTDSTAISRNEELFGQLRLVAKDVRGNGPKNAASPDANSQSFVDCRESDMSGSLAEGTPLKRKQIYGTLYEWKEISVPERGICIYVSVPLRRGLAKLEAEDFALVVRQPATAVPPTLTDPEGAEGNLPPVDAVLKDGGGSVVEQADSTTRRLTTTESNSFPFNWIALTRAAIGDYRIDNHGTAVQVSEYVWLTAAHNVWNKGARERFREGKIFRGWRNPSGQPSGEGFDIIPEPNYQSAPDAYHASAHDLAFIVAGVAHSHLPYPIPFEIKSVRDTGTDWVAIGCNTLNVATDPYYFQGTGGGDNTWYADSDYPCTAQGIGTTKTLVGYPSDAQTQPHPAANPNEYPYLTRPITLTGGYHLYNGKYRKLFYRCADCKSSIGMYRSHVTGGMSGGPIFGKDDVTGSAVALIGVITDETTLGAGEADGLGAGRFDWNSTWFTNNMNIVPDHSVTITTPTENGSYDSQHVPNLVASAGSQTSQLSWSSDIDGNLGTGGNVPLAGRLSPGSHTISGTIGSSELWNSGQRTRTATVFRTLHITITGSISTHFAADPSTVPIPATASSGAFAVTWNIPNYTSLDLQGQINGGGWRVPIVVGGSGYFVDRIPVGDTWEYRLLPHGAVSPLLGTLTVRGIAAPPPEFHATPTVVTVGSSTRGSYFYTWNAPGYDSIDIAGQVNDEGWHCCTVVGSSGSAGEWITASTLHRYRFYPHNDSTHLLGSVAINGVPATNPTFSAPPELIVPANATSGTFTLTWNAIDYPSLDLWGQVNNDPWHFGLNVQAQHSSIETIPVGSTYRYRFYPPGDSMHILKTLEVTAHH